MGLLVTAYAGIERIVNPMVDDGDLLDPKTGLSFSGIHFEAKVFPHWPHAAPEFAHGEYYTAKDTFRKLQCACSHYSAWRSKLADLVAGEDKAFYELINFSDCEGVLGPSTCVKLAQDFQRWDKLAQEYEPRGILPDYDFYGMYQHLKHTFEFAGIHGAVQFH